MKRLRKNQSRDGVALIMVLGLLAVMTVLSVAFAISMRVERVAARNYAHAVRAEQLVHTALVRALGEVNRDMVNQVYPDWRGRNTTNNEALLPNGNRSADAMCSFSPAGGLAPDLLEGEALRAIPHALLDDAKAMSPDWIDAGISNGRVTYIVINASGLHDANYVGGTNRDWSIDPHELDISGLPDVSSAANFLADRTADVRYETVSELGALNSGVDDPVSNLVTFSFDVGRDQFFDSPTNLPTRVDTNRPPPGLGRRTALLRDKFYVNSITNYAGYYDFGNYASYRSDQSFMVNYWEPLRDMLTVAQLERPTDVAWNLVNYLDPDRVPQGAETYPYRHTEGGEAIPVINEIVLEEIQMPGSTTNMWVAVGPRDPRYPGYYTNMTISGGPGYKFSVELWYPFAPVTVEPADNFMLQVGVFDQQYNGSGINELAIMNHRNTNWSFSAGISNMTFGTSTEFLVFTTPDANTITFPTNSTTGGSFAPIGSTDPDLNRENVVYFLARVLKKDTLQPSNVVITNPVDEAMGYLNGNEARHKRALKKFDRPQGFSVNDPRSNGQVKYWWSPGNTSGANEYIPGANFPENVGGVNYEPQQNTLGTTNVNCDPWSFKGQGVPLYAKNGPMINVGELGHIFRSNLDDEDDQNYWYWRNINLMRSDEGAMLLDLMTVRPQNKPASGLFCINSWQRDALRALFQNLDIGATNVIGSPRYRIPAANIDNLVDTIIAERDRRGRPFLSYMDIFTDEDSDDGGGGPVAEAFRECAPNGPDSNDIYKEDTFRNICELISFRNNIYIVLMAAQATQNLPNGDQAVLAERRAIATVYRDSYTGRHFTRSLKWLTE